jgi:hypothetical protein
MARVSEMPVLDAARSGVRPSAEAGAAPGTRRRLHLVLAGLWLLDGVLQFQPYMFTKSFAWLTLGPVADGGGPGWVTGPAHWVTGEVYAHPVAANTAFAAVQVALGLGIAYRPLLKPALAASIVWALGVWWLAEGFGGLPSGDANPLTGAPGAAVLYALAAVALWPGDRSEAFPAAGRIGERAARIGWLVLWGLLAWVMLWPANRAPNAVHDAITGGSMPGMSGMGGMGMDDDMGGTGDPAWLTSLDRHAGNLAAGRGLAVAIVLAVLFALIAVSVFAPWRRAVTVALGTAVGLCAIIWVLGQGLGMPYQGMATDPNSAPLLALLALAFWPARRASRPNAPSAQDTQVAA